MDGVNVRLTEGPTRVYERFDTVTIIGPVTDYINLSGSNLYDEYVQFTYDGEELLVSRDYIEEVTK